MYHRSPTTNTLLALLVVFTGAASATAGGGHVFPASAKVKGYSLEHAAAVTAVYNSGVASGSPFIPPPPHVPFAILVGDTTVEPGTTLYLPVFYSDDSGGAPPGFPADITDQEDDALFLDSQAFELFGVTAFIVQVDGHTTVLDDAYVSGVATAPLLDGTPPGTNYILSAAFLSPLSPGEHTVAIGGILDGEPVAFGSYTVTVSR